MAPLKCPQERTGTQDCKMSMSSFRLQHAINKMQRIYPAAGGNQTAAQLRANLPDSRQPALQDSARVTNSHNPDSTQVPHSSSDGHPQARFSQHTSRPSSGLASQAMVQAPPGQHMLGPNQQWQQPANATQPPFEQMPPQQEGQLQRKPSVYAWQPPGYSA
jgi:hypothetical protein